MSNYTLVDVCGTLRALPFFTLVLLFPGYCIGRATNVLGFRQRSLAEQWLWSIGLSAAVVPIVVNLASRRLSIHITLAACCVVAAIACLDLLRQWHSAGFPVRFTVRRSTIAALCLAAFWCVVCLVSLSDLQIGQRLYSTAAVLDLAVRNALLASAMHGGAPPANPFFYPEHIVNLRYYYYWYVLAAIPGVAAGVEPRAVLFASCVWSGWLLATVVTLFLKYFYGIRQGLRRTSVLAIALLGVTGLDVIYLLGLYFKFRLILFNTEVWDSDEVASWPKFLLWNPHHVAATCACMLGFIFLWHAGRSTEHSARQRVLLTIFAAFGFASAAGLSVYVTFAFAIFLVAAALYWAATQRFRTVAIYAAVAVLVVLMSIGYLHNLLATGSHAPQTASSPAAAQTSFVKIALRQPPPTLQGPLQRLAHGSKFAKFLIRPLTLVPILFLEFGFFFLIAVRQARYDWRRHAVSDATTQNSRDIRNLSWLMLAASLWVALMMRSTVISNNDLAFHGVQIAEFILLIWGAMQLAGTHPETEASEAHPPIANSHRLRIGMFAGSLLLMGIVSSSYQLVILRAYLWGSDRYNWTDPVLPETELDNHLGTINLQVRSAYAKLDQTLPPSARVQYGPAQKLGLQFMFYSRYQELVGIFPACGTDFGGSEAECARTVAQIAPIFGTSALPPSAESAKWQIISVPPLKSADQVRSLCQNLGIDALIVTAEDPVWHDPDAWPRTMKPIYASDFVAAYICH